MFCFTAFAEMIGKLRSDVGLSLSGTEPFDSYAAACGVAVDETWVFFV